MKSKRVRINNKDYVLNIVKAISSNVLSESHMKNIYNKLRRHFLGGIRGFKDVEEVPVEKIVVDVPTVSPMTEGQTLKVAIPILKRILEDPDIASVWDKKMSALTHPMNTRSFLEFIEKL